MRAIFIAVVLFATLLTFYSALWYKSETIEQDITKRVTEDLTTANAKDVAVDVDGRHVTLSGVVYDAETEKSYLDTADNTYGALGPIDGLTYVAGTGFVKAVKSADGITLKGSVPSEDARTALVEAASASTDGAVDDQLTIGAAAGDWEQEASFGLGQMAALSTGALAVTPGSYSLSGAATEDDAPIKAALADRDGWQSFTTAPVVGENLNARITALESDVSDRDQTIVDLTGERDTLAGERDALVGERDALTGERDGLTAEQSTIAAALAAMTVNRDTASTERDAKQKELDDLRASLDENQSTAADLIAARDAAQATVAERDGTIVELNGQITDLTARNEGLVDELATQTAALSGDQSALQDQLAAQSAKVDDLTGVVAERDTTIAGLQGDLSDKDAMIGTLKGDLDTASGTVDDLQGRLAVRENDVAKLTNELTAMPVANPEADARLAALTAAVAAKEAETDTLGKQVTDLTGVVAERDATIAALRSAPATNQGTAQMAEQCATRASGVLENARINFRTATATIDGGSIETLERLTGIALACVGDGLTVEIGGHTDSQGSDENNQALSERRAQAILAFMSERGVPTAGLKAVGYGEAKPIGDNATSEGRAQNRRISFDWQAR